MSLQGVFGGVAYTILTSASISSAGLSVLTVYPAVTVTANVSVSDAVPRQWQILVTPTSFVGVVNIGACVIV